jgi:hypothetical protein
VFEKLAGIFFGDALQKMVASFERRATAIYGDVAVAARQPAPFDGHGLLP